jgi:hypothetical protein
MKTNSQNGDWLQNKIQKNGPRGQYFFNVAIGVLKSLI